MFQSVDQNKNGVIDMEEFMDWVRPGGEWVSGSTGRVRLGGEWSAGSTGRVRPGGVGLRQHRVGLSQRGFMNWVGQVWG